MDQPLFSVIMPTYARQRFLDEAIGSVLGQTVPEFELIVVDDASPVPAAVPGEPRIRLIRRPVNGGPGAARNTGLDAARGRYVCFIDDDDLFTPNRLELALEGHRRSPIALCWAPFLGSGSASGRIREGWVSSSILNGTTPHLGGTSIERERVPRFDERFLAVEDVEWWVRASGDLPVSTVPAVGYQIRQHDAPRHRTDIQAKIRGSFLLLETHERYFRQHPRAAAFRWRRIGQLGMQAGDQELARAAFLRSMRLRPSIGTFAHLARALREGWDQGDVEGGSR